MNFGRAEEANLSTATPYRLGSFSPHHLSWNTFGNHSQFLMTLDKAPSFSDRLLCYDPAPASERQREAAAEAAAAAHPHAQNLIAD